VYLSEEQGGKDASKEAIIQRIIDSCNHLTTIEDNAALSQQ